MLIHSLANILVPIVHHPFAWTYEALVNGVGYDCFCLHRNVDTENFDEKAYKLR